MMCCRRPSQRRRRRRSDSASGDAVRERDAASKTQFPHVFFANMHTKHAGQFYRVPICSRFAPALQRDEGDSLSHRTKMTHLFELLMCDVHSQMWRGKRDVAIDGLKQLNAKLSQFVAQESDISGRIKTKAASQTVDLPEDEKSVVHDLDVTRQQIAQCKRDVRARENDISDLTAALESIAKASNLGCTAFAAILGPIAIQAGDEAVRRFVGTISAEIATVEQLPPAIVHFEVCDDVPHFSTWEQRTASSVHTAREKLRVVHRGVCAIVNGAETYFPGLPADEAGWSRLVDHVDCAFGTAVKRWILRSLHAHQWVLEGRALKELFAVNLKLSAASKVIFSPPNPDVAKLVEGALTPIWEAAIDLSMFRGVVSTAALEVSARSGGPTVSLGLLNVSGLPPSQAPADGKSGTLLPYIEADKDFIAAKRATLASAQVHTADIHECETQVSLRFGHLIHPDMVTMNREQLQRSLTDVQLWDPMQSLGGAIMVNAFSFQDAVSSLLLAQAAKLRDAELQRALEDVNVEDTTLSAVRRQPLASLLPSGATTTGNSSQSNAVRQALRPVAAAAQNAASAPASTKPTAASSADTPGGYSAIQPSTHSVSKLTPRGTGGANPPQPSSHAVVATMVAKPVPTESPRPHTTPVNMRKVLSSWDQASSGRATEEGTAGTPTAPAVKRLHATEVGGATTAAPLRAAADNATAAATTTSRQNPTAPTPPDVAPTSGSSAMLRRRTSPVSEDIGMASAPPRPAPVVARQPMASKAAWESPPRESGPTSPSEAVAPPLPPAVRSGAASSVTATVARDTASANGQRPAPTNSSATISSRPASSVTTTNDDVQQELQRLIQRERESMERLKTLLAKSDQRRVDEAAERRQSDLADRTKERAQTAEQDRRRATAQLTEDDRQRRQHDLLLEAQRSTAAKKEEDQLRAQTELEERLALESKRRVERQAKDAEERDKRRKEAEAAEVRRREQLRADDALREKELQDRLDELDRRRKAEHLRFAEEQRALEMRLNATTTGASPPSRATAPSQPVSSGDGLSEQTAPSASAGSSLRKKLALPGLERPPSASSAPPAISNSALGTPRRPLPAPTTSSGTPTTVGGTANPPVDVSLLELYKAECHDLNIKPNSGLLKALPKEPGRYVSSINLDLNYIGIKGVLPLFSVLKVNRGLALLNLKDNNLENNEVRALCTILGESPGSCLTYLDLSSNPISLAGGSAVMELVGKQRTLTTVVLRGTLIQPKVVERITEAAKGSSAGSLGTV